MAESARKSDQITWSTGVSSNTLNGDMSQTSITSLPLNTEGMGEISWQLKWAATGTPVGTVDVQVSNSYDPATSAGTWVTLDRASISNWSSIQATGVAGDHIVQLTDCPARWVRVLYTKTSGTGTINGWVFGRQG